MSESFLVTAKHPAVMRLVVEQPELQDVDETQTVNPWVSLLLLIVLSIHVILEGLALGSSDDAETIRSNFIAIVFLGLFLGQWFHYHRVLAQRSSPLVLLLCAHVQCHGYHWHCRRHWFGIDI